MCSTYQVYANKKWFKKWFYFTMCYFINTSLQLSFVFYQLLTADYYVRGESKYHNVEFDPVFSYQASKLSFRALMLASQKSQSPWRRGQGLGPTLRADSGSSRCRCTSQWCPPFPRPRRSRWGWRRPHSPTEGDKQREGRGHLKRNTPPSCNTISSQNSPPRALPGVKENVLKLLAPVSEKSL